MEEAGTEIGEGVEAEMGEGGVGAEMVGGVAAAENTEIAEITEITEITEIETEGVEVGSLGEKEAVTEDVIGVETSFKGIGEEVPLMKVQMMTLVQMSQS